MGELYQISQYAYEILKSKAYWRGGRMKVEGDESRVCWSHRAASVQLYDLRYRAQLDPGGRITAKLVAKEQSRLPNGRFAPQEKGHPHEAVRACQGGMP